MTRRVPSGQRQAHAAAALARTRKVFLEPVRRRQQALLPFSRHAPARSRGTASAQRVACRPYPTPSHARRSGRTAVAACPTTSRTRVLSRLVEQLLRGEIVTTRRRVRNRPGVQIVRTRGQRRELELPSLERLTGLVEHPGAGALVPAVIQRHASARLSLDASSFVLGGAVALALRATVAPLPRRPRHSRPRALDSRRGARILRHSSRPNSAFITRVRVLLSVCLSVTVDTS